MICLAISTAEHSLNLRYGSIEFSSDTDRGTSIGTTGDRLCNANKKMYDRNIYYFYFNCGKYDYIDRLTRVLMMIIVITISLSMKIIVMIKVILQ